MTDKIFSILLQPEVECFKYSTLNAEIKKIFTQSKKLEVYKEFQEEGRQTKLNSMIQKNNSKDQKCQNKWIYFNKKTQFRGEPNLKKLLDFELYKI